MLIYLILAATWLFAQLVQRRMKATYARYSAVPNRAGIKGAAVARHILDANGLQEVHLEVAPGTLTDHYDPRTHAIRLSLENARDASVAAMAVSAHEAAHALQDAADYAPLELRTAMFPVVKAGARFGIPVAILGSSLESQAMILPGHARLCGIRSSSTSSPFLWSSTPASGPWPSSRGLASRAANRRRPRRGRPSGRPR